MRRCCGRGSGIREEEDEPAQTLLGAESGERLGRMDRMDTQMDFFEVLRQRQDAAGAVGGAGPFDEADGQEELASSLMYVSPPHNEKSFEQIGFGVGNGDGGGTGSFVLTPENSSASQSGTHDIDSGGGAAASTSGGAGLDEKKKAQNRAAQKAYRERKEARMKDLEYKLRESELHREKLYREVEELRRANFQIQTTNRHLLQQCEKKQREGAANTMTTVQPSQQRYVFPTEGQCFENMASSKQSTAQGSEGILLTVPDTWEYLHKLSRTVDFDVSQVMDSLRGLEVCNGQGASYLKKNVDEMVANATV
ncbi:bZIP transcription factor KNAG_0A06790 [Huiozyma naganishii CBS 8797]|uniref:BZIP domain-containing protein n=1 Tax=Huiozyma naganishii (strain ATCC MYA-139 / BCRC 22969 / CBS 8797 / KCTC 17520 / NBRC 10181 / NCYC 3082 / Yp74L-3) TaxID=1071383 RepID=J7RFK8_HUIN7|nr:hypothetical protein KNAG_0A06790 [Kazachstania naganishii CBS 8797]CCK68333.1 hypothetical protein KNAG_0A06790 [Kazachstania naganishii CBS 8797]